MLSVNDFDYELPEELIAQHSVEPRDHSRLLVADPATKSIEHRQFVDIVDYLREGDVLVLNDSKVFKARLIGRKRGGTIDTEVTLLRSRDGLWEAMVYPGRRLKVGNVIAFDGASAEVVRKTDEGVTYLRFDVSDDDVFALCDRVGAIPTPPYVTTQPTDLADYQTAYAQHVGSVAAPTAGLHFTAELMEKIEFMGVQVVYVTLHIGLGTFQPMKTERVEDHPMHSEFVHISKQTVDTIERAKQEQRRVIAVGTTAVRSLEGAYQKRWQGGFAGDVDLFIQPGFTFNVVDALITNFHLPRTTLLVLVSAFAGVDFIKQIYQTAVQEQYRFFSFGDSMFLFNRD